MGEGVVGINRDTARGASFGQNVGAIGTGMDLILGEAIVQNGGTWNMSLHQNGTWAHNNWADPNQAIRGGNNNRITAGGVSGTNFGFINGANGGGLNLNPAWDRTGHNSGAINVAENSPAGTITGSQLRGVFGSLTMFPPGPPANPTNQQIMWNRWSDELASWLSGEVGRSMFGRNVPNATFQTREIVAPTSVETDFVANGQVVFTMPVTATVATQIVNFMNNEATINSTGFSAFSAFEPFDVGTPTDVRPPLTPWEDLDPTDAFMEAYLAPVSFDGENIIWPLPAEHVGITPRGIWDILMGFDPDSLIAPLSAPFDDMSAWLDSLRSPVQAYQVVNGLNVDIIGLNAMRMTSSIPTLSVGQTRGATGGSIVFEVFQPGVTPNNSAITVFTVGNRAGFATEAMGTLDGFAAMLVDFMNHQQVRGAISDLRDASAVNVAGEFGPLSGTAAFNIAEADILSAGGGIAGQLVVADVNLNTWVYTGIPRFSVNPDPTDATFVPVQIGWHEVPFRITFTGAGTSAAATIVVPAEWVNIFEVQYRGVMRIPMVVNIPEGTNNFTATLNGPGLQNGTAMGSWNIVSAVGGTFNFSMATTAINALTSRDVVRQPRMSIRETATGTFAPAAAANGLSGFYFQLPGDYVFTNATSLGVQAGTTATLTAQGDGSAQTIPFPAAYGVTTPHQGGQLGIRVYLQNFGTGAYDNGRPFDQIPNPWDTASLNTGRPVSGAGTFGGVWTSHMEVLSAIIQNQPGRGTDTVAAGSVNDQLRRLETMAEISNGIVTNIAQIFDAGHPVRNTNYAFASHGGSRINVVIENNAARTGVRGIHLTNVAIGHVNVNAPISSEAVNVTIGRHILNPVAGTIGAVPGIPDSMIISDRVDNPLVVTTARFRDYGFDFTRTGEPTNITAGRTYTEGAWRRGAVEGRNIVATTLSDFAGTAARVNLTELVPETGFVSREFTFTATDANGNVLEDVKIAAVTLNTLNTGGNGNGISNTTFYNVNGTGNRNWNVLGQGANADGNWTGSAGLVTTPRPVIEFSPSGHHVAVQHLRTNVAGANHANTPMQSDRLTVEATFHFSVNPNFEGPIYVAVDDNRNFDMQFRTDFISDEGLLHVANVRKPITVESTPTTVSIGFATVNVNNIVLTEDRAGDFRQGSTIEIGLGEHAHSVRPWSGLGFNAVSANNVAVTNANPNPNLRTDVSVATQPGGIVTLQVLRATGATTPSTITLSGLSVQAHQSVPVGNYNLYVRGSAIMDNDYWTVNDRPNPGAFSHPLLQFNETGHRRYAFTQGLVVEENPIYVSVIHPTPHGVITSVVRATVGSNIVSVDDVTRMMTNADGVATPLLNIQDRTFIPLRGLMEVLDGGVSWGFTNGPGTPVFVEIAIGDRVALFTVGSMTATVNGQTMQMDVAPVNLDGSVFVPLGFVGQALGVPVNWVQETSTVWFNNTGVGVPMTVVAALELDADVADVDDAE
jgi:hypothetical protein